MSRFEDSARQGGQGEAGQGGSMSQVKESAAQVGQQLKDVGQQAKAAAQEQYQNIREQAGQYYEQGRDMAQQYYEQGRQRAMEMEESFEDYVRQQPVKAVLMAAGIGLVLGFLWRRS